jgi:methyltransferase
MVTRWIFTGFVGLLALQRLAELRLSRRNETRIQALGGQEHAAGQIALIKALHTTWFLAMVFEVFRFKRPFIPALTIAALALLALGQSLRYAAIRALGWRWNVRVMTLPDAPRVKNGIYRYLRHPNYLGVIFEILAVPLLHSAYLTALVGSVANGILLILRIRAEELAWREALN